MDCPEEDNTKLSKAWQK